MRYENSIERLKETRIRVLRMIEKNPKSKELKEITQILDGTIKNLEKLELQEKNDITKGILAVDIDGHRFVKREGNDKEIELYIEAMLEKGKFYYLQSIPVCKVESKYLNDLGNLKKFASTWYKEKIIKGA